MNTVLDEIGRHRLVPVAVIDDPTTAVPLGRAVEAGGLSCVEVTLRTPTALLSLRALAAETSLLVGAGTVLTRTQADDAVAAGARFIVSPGFSAALVRHCQQLGVPVLPGVATVSEIMAALDEGIEVMKFFPAEQSGGADWVRAVAGPLPSARFVPTGGITAALLPDYLALPSVFAVGGSWMVASSLVKTGDWSAVTKLTEDAVGVVRDATA